MSGRVKTRELACRLAAQVCQGHLPTGTTLLSYIIMFESYIDNGGDEAANLMGWDVKEREPISLAVVRERIREEIS